MQKKADEQKFQAVKIISSNDINLDLHNFACYGLTVRIQYYLKEFGQMKKKVALLSVLALAAVLVSATLYAQPADPSGTWVNINDKTGKPEAELLVFKGSDGKIYGKILTVYGQDPATKCTACKGADYNQTVNGLVIVRGLVPDGDKWGGGYILTC
jgi:hypothetical protein